MLRPATLRGRRDVGGPAGHELRQRAIGVGSEQADDVLVEREDLNLDRAGRQADDDIVAAKHAVARGDRVLNGEAKQQCEDHSASRKSSATIDAFRAAITYTE